MIAIKKIILILSLLIFLGYFHSFGQKKERKIIQFSGVIFDKDTTATIPNAHVYIPSKKRGTSSNIYGFFSFPLLEGDTVVLRCIGFKKQVFVIPPVKTETLNKLFYMEEDTIFLKEVEISPYPSELLFKQAVLALKPESGKESLNIYRWMDQETLAKSFDDLPASSKANFQAFYLRQIREQQRRYAPVTNSLLNPFAWAQFIRSVSKKKQSKN